MVLKPLLVKRNMIIYEYNFIQILWDFWVLKSSNLSYSMPTVPFHLYLEEKYWCHIFVSAEEMPNAIPFVLANWRYCVLVPTHTHSHLESVLLSGQLLVRLSTTAFWHSSNPVPSSPSYPPTSHFVNPLRDIITIGVLPCTLQIIKRTPWFS